MTQQSVLRHTFRPPPKPQISPCRQKTSRTTKDKKGHKSDTTQCEVVATLAFVLVTRMLRPPQPSDGMLAVESASAPESKENAMFRFVTLLAPGPLTPTTM